MVLLGKIIKFGIIIEVDGTVGKTVWTLLFKIYWILTAGIVSILFMDVPILLIDEAMTSFISLAEL